MTREVKLSLILGFAVVLAVGVLLSDHLSGARQARLEGLNPERGIDPVATAPYQNEATSLILVDEQGRPEPRQPQVRPVPSQGAPKAEPVYPVRVAEGPVGQDQPASGDASLLTRLQARLSRGVQDAVTDLRTGHTPPEAAQLATIDGVRFAQPDDLDGTEPDPVLEAAPIIPAKASGGFRQYDVREGDTLWSIASRELGDGSRHKELSELNRDRLGKSGVLRVGATLRIPSDGRSTTQTATSASTRSTGGGGDPAAAARKKNGRTVYTVRQGDTLSGLAAKFLGSSSKYEDLLMANAGTLKDEDSLAVGMELNIPGR